MKQGRHWGGVVVATVATCALLGGMYGARVEATTSSTDEPDLEASLSLFTKIYDVVERNYADSVDPDKVIFGAQGTGLGAIPGMLRTLDPHSNFFDQRAFALLREDQEGKYYGVGMQIGPRPSKMGKLVTIVVAPMPGSPAFRAGLRPGDVILKVDGKSTEGLTTADVADMLKGPRGTVVHVVVGREGFDELLEFSITRDEISRRSVDNFFMLRPGIAYVHIATFNERTNQEFTEALKKLSDTPLQGLILDLRGNAGGLLQEAVEVAGHFLAKNQLIVYHYGRRSREKRYYATRGSNRDLYPIVVLINRATASAAEILSGALQDHDRALIIGEPSFGKGLVQTVYPLAERTGLALTTARYYTPSGRLIQREYANVSLYDYYYNRRANSTAPNGDVRLTDGGRQVYGGGGITPDIFVPEPKLTPAQELLRNRGAFFNFGKYYLGIHKTIPREFEVTDAVIEEFKQFLAREKIHLSEDDLRGNLEFIKRRILLQLVASIYGENEAEKISIQTDPVIQQAIDSLPKAKELLTNARRYMASKQQQ